MLEIVRTQIEHVKLSYNVSDISEKPDGSIHILIVNLALPAHWNRDKIDVLVILPVGYPQTMPNGFSAKLDGINWASVCYRPNIWDPVRDNLWKWIKMIERYFEENRP